MNERNSSCNSDTEDHLIYLDYWAEEYASRAWFYQKRAAEFEREVDEL